jgi:hypothetical protein
MAQILKVPSKACIPNSGKSYKRGRSSTFDLRVLTSSDQLIFIVKILFTYFTKQATLMRRSTVLSLNPRLEVRA